MLRLPQVQTGAEAVTPKWAVSASEAPQKGVAGTMAVCVCVVQVEVQHEATIRSEQGASSKSTAEDHT